MVSLLVSSLSKSSASPSSAERKQHTPPQQSQEKPPSQQSFNRRQLMTSRALFGGICCIALFFFFVINVTLGPEYSTTFGISDEQQRYMEQSLTSFVTPSKSYLKRRARNQEKKKRPSFHSQKDGIRIRGPTVGAAAAASGGGEIEPDVKTITENDIQSVAQPASKEVRVESSEEAVSKVDTTAHGAKPSLDSVPETQKEAAAVIPIPDPGKEEVQAPDTKPVTCGCPETCGANALEHSNGHHVCGTRIEFLMTKYKIDETEACVTSSEGDNPPCSSSCKPGVCESPKPESMLNRLELQEQNETKVLMENAPPKTSLLPWSNLTSVAFKQGRFYSGFRNQMQVFTVLVMNAVKEGYGQILIESISMKDTYGTNKQVAFKDLWDVEHWNSHYPKLPRLVMSDPVIHEQFNPGKDDGLPHVTGPYKNDDGKWTYKNGTLITPGDETRPIQEGQFHHYLSAYGRYSNGVGPFIGPNKSPNAVDVLMQRSALRLHPDLQALVDHHLNTLSGNATTDSTQSSKKVEYLTLHARVEPDMQRHQPCGQYKVKNLTQVIDMLYEHYPEPPVSAVFMPINREALVREGYPDTENPENTNWIAVDNLKALDDALEHGLWGGRVKAFRFGANVLEGTKYEDRPSITGSMLAYFISLDAKVFIGTRISSYSHALATTRFHQGKMDNLEYLPDGLHDWTPVGSTNPPGFVC